jgi:hypothetical protein
MLKIAAAASLMLVALTGAQTVSAPATDAPGYTAGGKLVAPTHYREWVYLTSGIDMSYAAESAPPDHHMFDNVFVNPSSYRSFLATGAWPDKTTLVLEVRGADSPTSINKRGHTQSAESMGMEIHVKDHGVWSFYDLPDGARAADLISRPAACYSCHEAHGAVDTTFVQFYPTLLPVAAQKQTLSDAYRKDSAATK